MRSPRACARRPSARAALHGAIAAFAATSRARCASSTSCRNGPRRSLSIAAVADPEEPIALETLLVRAPRSSDDGLERQARLGQARAASSLAILALMALWRFTPLREVASRRGRHRLGQGLRRAAGGRRSALMPSYTPACLVMFPRPLITLAAVIAFGPWLGFLYSLTGICFSSAVTWYMGRHMRRDTVRRLAGPKLDRMVEVLKKHGLLAMTLLRLVPLAPFAVESIVAGAIRMKLWHRRGRHGDRPAARHARPPRSSATRSRPRSAARARSTGGSSAARWRCSPAAPGR